MAGAYYLSLGSNLEPEVNLPAAVKLLRSYGVVSAASRVYETPPLGAKAPQPNYLNAVVRVDSNLEPLEFQNKAIGEIESTLGRVRTADKYAARTIDIDILLVDRRILHIEHRPVPSPEILERNFVAIPLAEIAPALIHPETGESIAAIAARFGDRNQNLVPRPDVDLDVLLT